MREFVRPSILLATSLILFSFLWIESTSWKIKPDYQVAFTSDNPAGIFKTLDGKIDFDPNDLSSSSFDLRVDVKSINTGNGVKNKHAVSEDWFDADKYPSITFRSVKIIKEDGQYLAMGNLKIKSISKAIRIPFNFEKNVFLASFTVDRMDYGVGTMEGMAKKAAQILKIEVQIPVEIKK